MQCLQLFRHVNQVDIYVLRVEAANPIQDMCLLLEQEPLLLLLFRLRFFLSRDSILDNFKQDSAHLKHLLVHDIYTL